LHIDNSFNGQSAQQWYIAYQSATKRNRNIIKFTRAWYCGTTTVTAQISDGGRRGGRTFRSVVDLIFASAGKF